MNRRPSTVFGCDGESVFDVLFVCSQILTCLLVDSGGSGGLGRYGRSKTGGKRVEIGVAES